MLISLWWLFWVQSLQRLWWDLIKVRFSVGSLKMPVKSAMNIRYRHVNVFIYYLFTSLFLAWGNHHHHGIRIFFIHLSIHPSIHLWPLVQGQVGGGRSLSREAQTFLSTATCSSSSRGIPRRSQASQDTKSLQLVLGLLRDLLPAGRALNASPGKHPGGILIRCPSHLIWLLLAQRSSGRAQPP